MPSRSAVVFASRFREAAKVPVMNKEYVLAEFLDNTDINTVVIDIESFEILWLNKAFRHHYDKEGVFVGRKCYEVLHGRECRCHRCKLDELLINMEVSRQFREGYSEMLGRTFLVYDGVGEWERGRRAHVEFLVDITDVRAGPPSGPEALADETEAGRLINLVEGIIREAVADNRLDLAFGYIHIDGSDGIGDLFTAGLGPHHHYLLEMAHAISDCTRAGDYVGRIGANEFLVVFPQCTKRMAKNRLLQARTHFSEQLVDMTVYPVTFGFSVVDMVELLHCRRYDFSFLISLAEAKLNLHHHHVVE